VRVPSYKDELSSNRMLDNVAAILSVDADEARFVTDNLHVEIIRRHLGLVQALGRQEPSCDVAAQGWASGLP
jgi:hypothetical protein